MRLKRVGGSLLAGYRLNLKFSEALTHVSEQLHVLNEAGVLSEELWRSRYTFRDRHNSSDNTKADNKI